MKITPPVVALALLALAIANAPFSIAFGQNTAFTYQGRVLDNGAAFSGSGEFKFALVNGTNSNQTATAAANPPSGGFVTIINVVNGGSGYTVVPVVTISGGGGSGAAAHAILSGGKVATIIVDNPGSGYSSAPSVTVGPPAANVSYSTYWSNDGTSVNGSEPVAAVTVPVIGGLFTVILGDTTQPNMTAIAASIFTQPDLQLRIWFNDGVLGFAALDPLQSLTAAPYAVTAANASGLLGQLPVSQLSGSIPATQLTGTLPFAQLPTAVVTNNQPSVNLSGTFSGNGSGLVNISGTFSWQVVSGTNQQAQSNTGYLLMNPGLTTLTLPASPNIGDVVRVSSGGINSWRLAQNSGQSVLLQNIPGSTNVSFTSPQPGVPVTNWSSVASSANGATLAAVVFGGDIYRSFDSGATWSDRTPGLGITNWTSVASSADGSQLVAVSFSDNNNGPGLMFISTDFGASWAYFSGSPSDSWIGIASSSDGTRLVAAAIDNNAIRLYVSTYTDAGVTWSTPVTFSVAIPQFVSVASSATGDVLVAAADGGQIYVSVDGGAWTPRDAARNWVSVASSGDGNLLVAANNLGKIYTSVNQGTTWVPQAGSPTASWSAVTSSADGKSLAATAFEGPIYRSFDSGITWTAPAGSPTDTWSAIASSSDGTKLVEVASGGPIYTTILVPATTQGSTGFLQGTRNAAVELQYVGNGNFLPLSHEGTLLGQ